jgi:hypothetical protein
MPGKTVEEIRIIFSEVCCLPKFSGGVIQMRTRLDTAAIVKEQDAVPFIGA